MKNGYDEMQKVLPVAQQRPRTWRRRPPQPWKRRPVG
jgi:hypothetical protein